MRQFWSVLRTLAVGMSAIGATAAQPPGEVSGVLFSDRVSLEWAAVAGADDYNVYGSSLAGGEPGRCLAQGLVAPPYLATAEPPAGNAFFFLVTARSQTGGEGSPGTNSAGQPRPLLGSCAQVLRHHVLNRIGYGWDEWSRDRVQALGLPGYITAQLNPAAISEFTNLKLQSRLAEIGEPDDVVELIRLQLVRAVYSRRQLEQQAAEFWTNHFNTDWTKVEAFFRVLFPACDSPGTPAQCDANFPARAAREAAMAQYRESNDFRRLAFTGSFREMVEASALSPAMIIYLDTITSVAGAPNENFPRELMELHTMGVDGGYTQQDVEQLSRVITGWTLCKKAPADLHDPLAPCLPQYWDPGTPGEIVATFLPSQHDCSPKTLFAGTPQQFTIPATCAVPTDGAQELFTALDAIVAHASTAPFISRKILERFVTEAPTPAMIDALVGEWNDAGNPHGVGDLRAVLKTALELDAFLDPTRVRSKVKTPLEQFTSALRGTDGRTDGVTTILEFLISAQHLPYLNPTPTGWPEDGGSWIGTNNTLDRQNFGLALAGSPDPLFGAEPIDLLATNGVSTAPGNAAAIVDFLTDALFGGALTPAERQTAIDFLNTDDVGHPAPYDDARIRDLVALLLGFPQFQEQ